MAGSIGVEPIHQFPSEGLAIPCLNRSANYPHKTIKLVVGEGYDPSRSSPSDQSPGVISARRTPVLPTTVILNSSQTFQKLRTHF